MKALLIDPIPPQLAWCELTLGDPAVRTTGRIAHEAFPQLLQERNPEVLVYALPHGGTNIRQLISRVDDLTLERLTHTIAHMPEHNALTVGAVRTGKRLCPAAKHFLVCDTAAFSDLPDESAHYAVPPKLRGRGIRRYGLNGLAHRRALERAREESGQPLARVITVYLAPHTSLAAFDGEAPRDTSAGFTPVEGLPSMNSCGDIDPTVALHMVASGMHFHDVQRVLGQESGLQALCGERVTFAELLREGPGGTNAFARETWCFQLVKMIGSFTAVLGGVDALAFAGAPDVDAAALAREIAPRLSPLRILLSATHKHPEVTTGESPVRVFAFANDRWQNMAFIANRQIQRGA